MSQAPHLALNLSRSPLLPHVHVHTTSDDLISTLLTKRRLDYVHPYDAKRPTYTREYVSGYHYSNPYMNDSNSLSSFAYSSASSLESTFSLDSGGSTPHAIQDSTSTNTITDKPLPCLPSDVCMLVIPPQAVIQFLDLLDQLDADVASEVARVKDGIKEAHTTLDLYKDERVQREKQGREKRAREKRETKEIGSDFWLGV